MPKSKARRGANGGGTLYHRTDGRWEGRYTVGFDPGTGKPVRKSIYGKTQKEVRQRLTEITRQLDTNTYAEPDKRPLGAYLDSWMSEYVEPVRANYTISTYRGIIKNHIKPNLGAVRLCDLTTDQVQKMVRKLVNAGKAPKTIKNTMTVLNSALEQAVKEQVILRNPAKYAKLPSVQAPEIKTLSVEEIAAFMDAAEGCPYYAPLMCCLFLGLREGEALGLAWEHIDFENGKALICQQLQKEKTAHGAFYIKHSTKTGQSRTLDLPDFLINILKEEQRRQTLARIAAGPAWGNEWGLCFTDALGGCINPHTLWANCKRIAKSIGLPDARVHDLRHPYVKHTTKIFSLRLMDFQAQVYPDARRKTRGACQPHRGGQSQSPARPLCNRKRFSCLPPQSKMSWILYAISMRLSGYTSTRSISNSASAVVSVSASKIALDASLRLSCRACSPCFCFACANTAA